MAGDTIVAYAKGVGAIGWGTIESPNTYKLVAIGDAEDVLQGNCRHRITVNWKAAARNLKDGLPADSIRQEFNIYHPISTSVSINALDGKRLLDRLSERFRVQTS